jgi:hypothetical protein
MNDLPFAYASLVVFVHDDVLFLVSLTITHGEAGLPTSTTQRGGLHEVSARGRSLGLGSSDLCDQACSRRQEASYSLGAILWTSLGPLSRWVPGPTTRWAPGTTRLVPYDTSWRGAHGLRWRSTRIGSYTCPVLCRELLAVPN